MSEKFNSAIDLSESVINNFLKEGMVAVDATMGNGNDIYKLAKAVGERGSIYGFDIQEEAYINTFKKLSDAGFKNFELINDGHENMDNYIENLVDFVIFNLGYLPKGSHSITTKFETTIVALEKSMSMLNENGIIAIVLYPGHHEGKKEKDKIQKYLEKVDQKEYNILKSEFINQKNNPPLMILIEKR